jgi:O-antigen ligase
VSGYPLRDVPVERARRPRVVLGVILICAVGVLLGVSGLTAHEVFLQPSRVKWAVSFIGPAYILLVLTVRRPLFFLVGALIVCAPLGSLGAQFGGVHVPLELLILLTAGVAAVLDGPPPSRMSPIGLAGILAVALLLVPLLSGSGIFAHVILFATAGYVAWLVSIIGRQKGGLDWLFAAVSVAAVLQSIAAIYEVVTKHQINFYGSAGSTVYGSSFFFRYGSTFRPVGTFYDPISLGNVLAVAIPIQLIVAVRQPSLGRRLVATAALAITGAALLLSLSRMSWVGGIIGLLLMLVLLPPVLRRRGISVLLPMAVAVLIAATGANSQAFGRRLDSIFAPTSSSTASHVEDQQREADWAASLQIWSSHPVGGVGLGKDPTALAQRLPLFSHQNDQSQSVYFQLLAEAGVLGAAALVLVVLTHAQILLGAWKTQDRAAVVALAGSTVAMLIGWTTDVTVRYAPVAACMAVLFGAGAAIWQRKRSSDRPVHSADRPI